jgi:hypothetical protein
VVRLLVVLIALLSIDYSMLFEVVARRDALRAGLLRRAHRVPGFQQFLEDVRAQTKPGDSIALIVGARDPRVYGYGQIRASYVLAGRRVVRMTDDVAGATHLALFRMEYKGNAPVVWRSRDGILVRQR